jgi:hypothetical protein
MDRENLLLVGGVRVRQGLATLDPVAAHDERDLEPQFFFDLGESFFERTSVFRLAEVGEGFGPEFVQHVDILSVA